MRWTRRLPDLSEVERDLLVRLSEGDVLDFTSEEFWLLDKFRRLKLIERKVKFNNRRVHVVLSEKGERIALGIKARRWVEEHGTEGTLE